jgi:CRP-like cAMP-binding protein
MHDYELDDVIDAMQESSSQPGDVIIQEGEPGELFYILEEGNFFDLRAKVLYVTHLFSN